MSDTRKKIENFGDWKPFKVAEEAENKNTLTQSKKKPKGKPGSTRDEKIWLTKSCDDRYNELFGLEFMRMIMDPVPKKGQPPLCPKARIMVDDNRAEHIVISLVDFTPLYHLQDKKSKKDPKVRTTHFAKEAIQGKKTGLGEVSTLLAFLAAPDPHDHNLGVNKNGRLIAIDLEGAFEQSETKNSLSTELIEALPSSNGPNFLPFNWFGEITKGDSTPEQSFIPITNNKEYQNRINREKFKTILKICMLTPELINKFISSYTNDEYRISFYKDFFTKRQMTMLSEAMKVTDNKKNKIFLKYFLSDEAKNDLLEYIDELKNFKTMRKDFLLGSPSDDAAQSILDNYEKFKNNLKASHAQPQNMEEKKRDAKRPEQKQITDPDLVKKKILDLQKFIIVLQKKLYSLESELKKIKVEENKSSDLINIEKRKSDLEEELFATQEILHANFSSLNIQKDKLAEILLSQSKLGKFSESPSKQENKPDQESRQEQQGKIHKKS